MTAVLGTILNNPRLRKSFPFREDMKTNRQVAQVHIGDGSFSNIIIMFILTKPV